jgi:hypothetical protein
MSYLELKESGPLVVYAPPGVIGMFTDFYQHTLTDVGAAGPAAVKAGFISCCLPDTEGQSLAATTPSSPRLTTCSYFSVPF